MPVVPTSQEAEGGGSQVQGLVNIGGSCLNFLKKDSGDLSTFKNSFSFIFYPLFK
jgi:hypothetical protein